MKQNLRLTAMLLSALLGLNGLYLQTPAAGITTAAAAEQLTEGQYIRGLVVYDTANEAAWSLQSDLQQGDTVFGDRAFTFTSVPAALAGAEYVQSACNSKKFTDVQASFQAGADIMVYAALDDRVSTLPWLADWFMTTETLADDGDPAVTYRVYKKAFSQGETVTIGALGVANAVNLVVMAKALAADTTAVVIPDGQSVCGDMNGDGRLTAADLSLMKQRLGTDMTYAESKIADVNADGVNDGRDAAMLTDYLLHKITAFPETFTSTTEPAPEQPMLTGTRRMEYLDRGVSAVKAGNAVFVSWRSLVGDDPAAAFHVYRTTDGQTTRLTDTPLTGGTNFTDKTADLTKTNTYSVKMVVDGREIATDGSDTIEPGALDNCKIIPIKAGSTIHFVWTGDFDGDGAYDFLVDRPGDDHQLLEAYRSDGTYLWTMDMGANSENKNNISPGASTIDVGMWDGATVYDIDCDGYAEVLVRIADGVKFGNGKTYSEKKANAQAIAVLDGRTGALKATAPVPEDYIQVGPMACMMEIGYLNGKTPSLVCWLKNRNADKSFNSLMVAYGYENGSFRQQWKYDNKKYAEAHQIRILDVDSDGKDEVLHQGYALNGDGKLRYAVDGVVHGDRWFVGAFNNGCNGGEMLGYGIQQSNSSGLLEYFYNASTGKVLWKNQTADGSTYDVGRGNVGDIDPAHPGFECYSFQGTWSVDGQKICDEYMYPCIRLWWDGDLLSEQYNDGKIEEWNPGTKTTGRLLTPWKITSATGSERGAPMFYGDISGDWREEVIMTNSDFSQLVIFSTTNETDTRLYSLAQNPCYRNCMTAKGYYQSHMLDYFLGDGMEQPAMPDICIIQK